MVEITWYAPFATVLLLLAALASPASSLAAAPPRELAISPNGRYRICHVAGSGALGDYGKTSIVTNGTCAGGQSLRSFVTPYPPTVIRDDGEAVALFEGSIDWPDREVFRLLDPRDPARDTKVLAGTLITPARFASHTWPTPPMFDKHLVNTLTLRIDIPGAPLDVNLTTVRPPEMMRCASIPFRAVLV